MLNGIKTCKDILEDPTEVITGFDDIITFMTFMTVWPNLLKTPFK